MNILMNSSDNNVRDNGTKDDGDGYGGDIINNWNGGSYSGSGYGSGWSVHGSGWPSPDFGLVEIIREQPKSDFGDSGDGFGATGGGLENNNGRGA